MTTPLLVTGGSGYLGGELLRAAGPGAAASYLSSDPPSLTGANWLRLDVRDERAVEEAFRRIRPAAVVHTAYLQEGPEAEATNVLGSAHVAGAAVRAGARLVHVSTDVVFDGRSHAPYRESDPANPLTAYGRSKLEAERRVLASHPGALVVRTSLMVGRARPGRQEQAVLAAARGESEATYFEDEWRSPVLVADLALALLELAGRDRGGRAAPGRAPRPHPLRARLPDRSGARPVAGAPAPGSPGGVGHWSGRPAAYSTRAGRVRSFGPPSGARAPVPRIRPTWTIGSGG